jgi:hypothetical protein
MKTTPLKTTPKMLPWLARSAGLTDQRAEALWWEASHYGRKATGEFDTAKYWRVSMDRFLGLMQAEAVAKNPPETAPWVMIQSNLQAGLLLVTEFLAEVSTNLRRWFSRALRHAA